MKDNFKLSLQEYESLYDDNIPKKKYDEIIEKIHQRFGYIMKKICSKLVWFDFDNGWENNEGYFEPNEYHKSSESYISFQGNFTIPEPYNHEVPIKWLYEDFEEDFKKQVELFKIDKIREKEKKKQKREEVKVKKQTMKEIIRGKLSKEELKYIKFK